MSRRGGVLVVVCMSLLLVILFAALGLSLYYELSPTLEGRPD